MLDDSDVVQLWSASLRGSASAVASAKKVLTASECARAERFVRPGLHDEFVLAHAALRRVLAAALGHPEPKAIALTTGAHGKPALADAALQFNLSHSGEWALIAVTPQRVVGVDIERARPLRDVAALAKTAFSSVEQAAVAQADQDAARHRRFFRTWACKEAYIKAHGLGLAMPLDQFDIDTPHDGPARLAATRPDATEKDRWWLRELTDTSKVPADYAAAVVVARRPSDDAMPPMSIAPAPSD